MAGYNYTKRSVHSLHGWLQLHTLCMTGYNYTKRSVHSLHGWLLEVLQLH